MRGYLEAKDSSDFSVPVPPHLCVPSPWDSAVP